MGDQCGNGRVVQARHEVGLAVVLVACRGDAVEQMLHLMIGPRLDRVEQGLS